MNADNLVARAASTSSLARAAAVEAKERSCGALRDGAAAAAEALAAALTGWMASLENIVVVCTEGAGRGQAGEERRERKNGTRMEQTSQIKQPVGHYSRC